ncbi:MAG: FAD-dependent oxidoreductase [Pseudomonadota bacterium]
MSEDVSERRSADPRVVIVGGGLTGLGLAIALKDAGGFDVTVLDAAPPRPKTSAAPSSTAPMQGDYRASAITAAARRMLDTLQIWEAVEDRAQPILDMVLTDSVAEELVRPHLLTFDGEPEPGEPFAHMVPNKALGQALMARAGALGITVRAPARAVGLSPEAPRRLTLNDGSEMTADLVVAADGGRSALRRMARIRTVGWDYPQTAIVGTVAHTRPHQGRAIEHFLPPGPFATLPLIGDEEYPHQSSIVWTEASRDADAFLAMDEADFTEALTERFGRQFGRLTPIGGRAAYPLRLLVARDFVRPGLALAGDAAHVIHPIAGQGLNIGLKDIAALAEVLVDARRTGREIGSLATLQAYERWRRADVVTMAAATDGLNRLFSNSSAPLRALRSFGLRLTNSADPLKGWLVREAAGLTGDLPRLLQGDTL